MIGGASIIVCMLYWMFVDTTASTATIAVTAFNLSFIVNYPHFMASYQILYSDHWKDLFTKKSYFWAAFVAPAVILVPLIYGISEGHPLVLAYMIQAMYLSVGWHYVKQIFGVAIVTSAVQKRYFGAWERNFILLNLFMVWVMSWISANQSISKADLNGVNYFTLGFPEWMLTASYVATGATLLIAGGIMVQKYIKTGIRPATSSLVGFASIYFWYLPTLNHAVFFYLIPFFHSLQYMLFVYTLKLNEAEDAADQKSNQELQRKIFLKKFLGFFAISAVLGVLAFEWIPKFLDNYSPIGAGLPTNAVWYFAFGIFINLHHYFIDNVIWRGDNELLKKYLVQASQKKALNAA